MARSVAGRARPAIPRPPDGSPGSADEGGAVVRRGVGDGLDGGRRRLHVEQVADALERLDAARLTRLRAELATDARHPDPQVLEVVAVFRAPDLGQQLGVEDD